MVKGVSVHGKVYKLTSMTSTSRKLSLSNLDISNISEIIGLQDLRHRITDLDLSYNNIVEITGLESLPKLKYLNLSYNQITNISSIVNLKNLRILNLQNNKIKDLKGISALQNLFSLWVTINNVSDIEEIYKLRNLKYLYVNGNHLEEIEKEKFTRKPEIVFNLTSAWALPTKKGISPAFLYIGIWAILTFLLALVINLAYWGAVTSHLGKSYWVTLFSDGLWAFLVGGFGAIIIIVLYEEEA